MKRAYVLRWRSPIMPAPAFWYFSTRAEAEMAADMLSPGQFEIARVTIHDDIELDGRGAALWGRR